MKPSAKRTYFKSEWLDAKKHESYAKWLAPVKGDKTAAKCVICDKTFSLSNMGKTAVDSHQQDSIHKRKLESVVLKDDVIKAELLWILHSIQHHITCNKNLVKVLQDMAPDSAIAKQLNLSPSKIACVAVFGLAPYFKRKLTELISKSEFFVACFDEAVNGVVDKRQMDVCIRFWSADTNKVECCYYGSVFMGHYKRADADDILSFFLEGLDGLEMNKLVQIGMDGHGPSVMWEFLDTFKAATKGDNDSKLLELSSCGLSVVHGAFEAGLAQTSWDISGFLRAIYRIFKNSPIRKHDFELITGTSRFPKMFRGHSWLENVTVVETAIDLLPDIQKYVENVNPKPNSTSFSFVLEALKDSFLKSKLEFFKSVLTEMQGFLASSQSSKPVAPFLYDHLVNILRSLFQRLVRDSVVENLEVGEMVHILKKMDVNYIGLKAVKAVDIGREASRSLPKQYKDTEAELDFFKCCQSFLMGMIQQLVDRCPLEYPLCRSISCLVPSRIVEDPKVAIQRFEETTSHLLDANRITTTESEGAVRQFEEFISTPDCKIKMRQFSEAKDRLDELFFSLLDGKPQMKELWKCVQIVLILSDGNANVENEFSVNDDLLLEKFKEESVVAQRIICDAIRMAGGDVLSVIIDREMIVMARSSQSAYKNHLEKMAKTEKETAKGSEERRKRNLLLKEKEAKRQKIQEETDV